MFFRAVKIVLVVIVLPLVSSQGLRAQSFDCLVEPSELIKVGSPVLGVIDEIPIKRGQTLEAGQLLAKLETDLELVSIELAETRLDYLQTQYQRLKTLHEKNLAKPSLLDEAYNDMAMAALELRRRRLVLEQKKIHSPISGVVVEKLLSAGEYVYEQTPIAVIAQTDPLNIEVLVPVAKFKQLRVGTTAWVQPQAPVGGRYEAQVEIIDGVMDAASATFGVRLSLANPGSKIPAGLRCTVEFEFEDDSPAPALPPS